METREVLYPHSHPLMTLFFLAGLAGGVIRGFVGLIKYTMSYKDVEIRPRYFAGMIAASGLIGIASAWAIEAIDITIAGIATTTPGFALIVGYAGGDFLEAAFKAITSKKLFS